MCEHTRYKYLGGESWRLQCGRPEILSVVDGNSRVDCEDERASMDEDRCGRDGIYWKEKQEVIKQSWWKRLYFFGVF